MRQRVVHECAGGKRAGACVEGPLRFNAGGVLAEVPMPERLALREKLRALRPGEPGSPVRDRDWARLLRWWLTPPAQRPSHF